jgi:hypothetical protein
LFVALAVLVTIAGGLYGIAAPLGFGHHGYHAGQHGSNARDLLRHGVFFAHTEVGQRRPPASSYSFHHPILCHQYLAVPLLVAGDREWVLRSVPFAFTLAIVLAVFLLGRRLWGHLGGGVAALVVALLPLTLAFNHLVDHEQPGILYTLLGVGGLAIYLTPTSAATAGPASAGSAASPPPRRRWLLLSIAGFLLAGLTDWPPYIIAFLAVLGAAMVGVARRVRSGPTPTTPGPAGAPAPAGALVTALAVLCLLMPLLLVFHLVLSRHFGRLADLEMAFGNRWTPGLTPGLLAEVRSSAQEVLPPVVLYPALAWLLLLPVRGALDLVRPRDLLPLAFGLGQMLHSRLFVNEAAFHVYRFYYLIVFVGFAFADITTTCLHLLRRWPRAGVLAVVAVVLPVIAFEARAGITVARESRRLMGSLGFAGHSARLEYHRFLQFVHDTTTADQRVLLDDSLPGPRFEALWYLDRDWRSTRHLRPRSGDRRPVVLARRSAVPLARLGELARAHPVTLIADDLLLIDLGRHGEEIRAYRVTARRPASWLGTFLFGEFHAPLGLARDRPGEVQFSHELGAHDPHHP